MAEEDKDLFPSSVEQNPSLVGKDSLDFNEKVESQADNVFEIFKQVVPSNYVSEVKGPNYTLSFQSAAEIMARFQVNAQEVFADSVYDFTRSEFLFQVIGALVFPEGKVEGIPTIEGDLSYRTFLKRMVGLLLQGTTPATIQAGVELLTEATIEVIERGVARRDTPNSGWGPEDQFVFEINASLIDEDTGLYQFPENPFIVQQNLELVMRALKPAHSLYEYRHLFQEVFDEDYFSADLTLDIETQLYQEVRRYCKGAKNITGTAGVTLSDRSLFSDPTRSFVSVPLYSTLVILTGTNGIDAGGVEGTTASTDEGHIGRYRVVQRLYFASGDDSTARAYTTSPTGLSGTATVSGTVITDESQDWGQAVEGEILTFSEGPNASASYRLETLVGNDGGPVGLIEIPVGVTFTSVAVSPSILKIQRRMPVEATSQSYTVGVDYLGVQEVHEVTDEDVSIFFL